MAGRGSILGVLFGAALLAAGLFLLFREPGTRAVAWRDLGEEVPGAVPAGDGGDAGSTAEVAALRRELQEMRRRLPGVRSRALASLPVPERATLCGQPVPLDRPEVREAVAYELLLTCGRPLMPMLWTRRAPAVVPVLEEKIRAAGMPRDLVYLAMVESDLRPTVRSPAGAVGVWQLVRGTARRYGLRVDRYLDERMDLERSTDAALAYLRDLRAEFGDWFLALAAYNAGENRVRAALADQGPHDVFSLYLPAETRRYVPRILAAKLVVEHPEDYGILPLAPLHVPRYRVVEIRVRGKRADLRRLSREHGLDYAALRLANPQLRGHWLPRGTHRLRIPVRPADPGSRGGPGKRPAGRTAGRNLSRGPSGALPRP